MKRILKGIIILFLIIFVLPIVLYGFYQRTNYHVITGSLDAQRISGIAIQKNDPTICGKIKKGFDLGPGPSEQELKDNCFIKTATSLKDIKICENVSSLFKKSCYVSIAYETNDEKLLKTWPPK